MNFDMWPIEVCLYNPCSLSLFLSLFLGYNITQPRSSHIDRHITSSMYINNISPDAVLDDGDGVVRALFSLISRANAITHAQLEIS